MISRAQENPNPIIYGTLPRFEKDDAKGRFIGALDSWPGKSGTKPRRALLERSEGVIKRDSHGDTLQRRSGIL
jgi:hypothetical protein